MSTSVNLGRRRFLKVGAAAGGGLLIGVYLPGARSLAEERSGEAAMAFRPNAWIRIDPDGRIYLEVARSEMGQGSMTSLPTLIAEELEVDLHQITPRFAPAHSDYVNRMLGSQVTGGSTGVREAWTRLREAGALAREMLMSAAAEAWDVPIEECEARQGRVLHASSERQLGYGELAGRAAKLPVPETVFLKEPDEFRLIGTPQKRLDTPVKTNGTARFGSDVRVPEMWMATVVRCPVFGGKPRRIDSAKAEALPGVRRVLTIPNGVAVVAEHTWEAFKGASLLQIDWDFGDGAAIGSGQISELFRKLAEGSGKSAASKGEPAAALEQADQKVEADYEVPFQAHACMEPMNCTAHVRSDGCDVWVPTQNQTRAQQTAMAITGLAERQVKIHTTFLGGGFGRRGEPDFVEDAVELSKRLQRPVQVLWTREQDMQHDYYRPATFNRMLGALDKDGKPVAWYHHIVGPSILQRVAPQAVGDGIDRTSVEGAANLPYAIPNLQVEYTMANTHVPVGFWRSVGSSQNAFVTECFLDELARAGGQDPYRLRLELLKDAPRHLGVLKLAAEKAGWDQPLAGGRFRGMAVAESFGSFVAQVAEISLDDKRVRVHRVVCAIDCGLYVNPDTIQAQMESGIAYGLTAALKGGISIREGRVEQSNFHDFPLLRLDEMPAVQVHILASGESPGGVGEPGTPPIAPAVANAVFAATGKPVRSLPIRL